MVSELVSRYHNVHNTVGKSSTPEKREPPRLRSSNLGKNPDGFIEKQCVDRTEIDVNRFIAKSD